MSLEYAVTCRNCLRFCYLGPSWPLLGVAAEVPLTERVALLLKGMPPPLDAAARLVWFLERHRWHAIGVVTEAEAADLGVFTLESWRQEEG